MDDTTTPSPLRRLVRSFTFEAALCAALVAGVLAISYGLADHGGTKHTRRREVPLRTTAPHTTRPATRQPSSAEPATQNPDESALPAAGCGSSASDPFSE